MKDILRATHREALETATHRRMLLAFDFDGTLAPIVERRHAARMRRSTQTLLIRLCSLYPVAIVSGRSREDLSQRLSGIGIKYLIGNHGLEPYGATRAAVTALNEARIALTALVRRERQIEIEDKRYSLAVHFRRSPRPLTAEAEILATIAALQSSVRVILGKRVVNVVPRESPNKGDALLALAKKERAHRVLFLGDDVTDEDVFQLTDSRLISIRVGQRKASAASYFIKNQEAVDGLLRTLIGLREKSDNETVSTRASARFLATSLAVESRS